MVHKDPAHYLYKIRTLYLYFQEECDLEFDVSDINTNSDGLSN